MMCTALDADSREIQERHGSKDGSDAENDDIIRDLVVRLVLGVRALVAVMVYPH